MGKHIPLFDSETDAQQAVLAVEGIAVQQDVLHGKDPGSLPGAVELEESVAGIRGCVVNRLFGAAGLGPGTNDGGSVNGLALLALNRGHKLYATPTFYFFDCPVNIADVDAATVG